MRIPSRGWAVWPSSLAGESRPVARHALRSRPGGSIRLDDDAPILHRGRPDFSGRPGRRRARTGRGAEAAASSSRRRRVMMSVGPPDRADHGAGLDVAARLGRVAGDRGVAGRPHQRVQPDRRRRRARRRHHGDGRRRLRRDPRRARSRAGSDAARRLRRRGDRLPVLQLRAGVDLPRRQRQPARRIRARRDRDHRLAEGRDGAGHRRAAADLRAADRRQRAGADAAHRSRDQPTGRSIARDAAADRAARSRAHPPSHAGDGLVGATDGADPLRHHRDPVGCSRSAPPTSPRHETRAAGAAVDAAARRRQRRGRVGAAGAGARTSRHGAVVAAGGDRADQSFLRHASAAAAISTRSKCRDRGALSPITCRCRRR